MQGKRYLTVYQKEILERVFTEVCPFITKTGKEKEEEEAYIESKIIEDV